MNMKTCSEVLKSQKSLTEMLVKFFTQNPMPQVVQYGEELTDSHEPSEEPNQADELEDHRTRYWRERNARPTIEHIGSNLEWGLLASLMSLSPGWRHDGWWCDGVYFLGIDLHRPSQNTLHGLAITYWEPTDETKIKQANVDRKALAEFELKLINTPDGQQLEYSISLWVDEYWHWFSDQDFMVLPLSSAQSHKPNISILKQIYEGNEITKFNSFYSAIGRIVNKFAPDSIAEHPRPTKPTVGKCCLWNTQISKERQKFQKLSASELIILLDGKDQRKARQSADWLGSIGEAGRIAIPKLLSIIYDEEANLHLRSDCLDALIEIGINQNDSEKLFRFLAYNSEYSMYSKAVAVIAHTDSSIAIPAILKVLKDSSKKDEIDYSFVLEAFEYLRKQASISDFVELLETDEWRRQALSSLHFCGDNAVPKLLELLTNPEISVRAQAIVELGEIKNFETKTLTALQKALHDPDLLVSIRAAEALSKIGVPAMPILIDTLGINNKLILCWIIKSLGEIGVAAKHALKKLQPLASSNDLTIRYFANRAIHQIS